MTIFSQLNSTTSLHTAYPSVGHGYSVSAFLHSVGHGYHGYSVSAFLHSVGHGYHGYSVSAFLHTITNLLHHSYTHSWLVCLGGCQQFANIIANGQAIGPCGMPLCITRQHNGIS